MNLWLSGAGDEGIAPTAEQVIIRRGDALIAPKKQPRGGGHMNGVILCVGKLKEPWQRDGCAEYLKRLSRYGKYEIIAVDDLPAPERASAAQLRQIVDREGQALLKHVRSGDRVIALCVQAEAPDSVGLSRMLERYSADGRRSVFVIGGSNGLSDAVLARADARLSFSNLTFPHGLMRVILLEQLYRAEKIRAGEPYHK